MIAWRNAPLIFDSKLVVCKHNGNVGNGQLNVCHTIKKNWNSFHTQSFITPTTHHSISTSSLWFYSKRNLLTSSNSPWIFLEQICIDIENILVIHHLPPIVVWQNWSECFRISAMLTLCSHTKCYWQVSVSIECPSYTT